MTKKTVLIDDFDGSEANETIKYSFDGQDFEIDLSAENAKRFRAAIAPFLEKSRLLSTGTAMPRSLGEGRVATEVRRK